MTQMDLLCFQDKYILTSMSILCLICIWHAIVPIIVRRGGKDTAEHADHIALGLLALIYVAFHILFVFWVGYMVSGPLLQITQFAAFTNSHCKKANSGHKCFGSMLVNVPKSCKFLENICRLFSSPCAEVWHQET